MASKLMFDRKWKIVLSLEGEKDRTIRDLKVTFNIVNTLLGDYSLASFQIYNINKETESYITSHGCTISLRTGYHEDIEKNWNVLFTGEITNSHELRQGLDTVWNVWARESFSIINQPVVDFQSYQVETPRLTVLNKLIEHSEEFKGKITYIDNALTVLTKSDPLDQYSATESYGKEFSDILPSNLGWAVQNGEFFVFDIENPDPISLVGAIEISREKGLLTVPIADYTGVKFSTLLDGQLKPLKVINIKPNTIKYNLGNEFYVKRVDKEKWRAQGLFRIMEVTHRGDTRGETWDTSVTAFYRKA